MILWTHFFLYLAQVVLNAGQPLTNLPLVWIFWKLSLYFHQLWVKIILTIMRLFDHPSYFPYLIFRPFLMHTTWNPHTLTSTYLNSRRVAGESRKGWSFRSNIACMVCMLVDNWLSFWSLRWFLHLGHALPGLPCLQNIFLLNIDFIKFLFAFTTIHDAIIINNSL